MANLAKVLQKITLVAAEDMSAANVDCALFAFLYFS